MRTHRSAALALAFGAAVFLVGPGAPAGAAPPGAGTGPAARSVLTVTGDRINLNGDHRGGVVPAASGGPGRTVLGLGIGGRHYVLPADALPYLGRQLDPGLFDVAALAAVERDGRVPVRIGYTGAKPALAGVTVTGDRAGERDGYLTASSAADFGRAVLRQYLADRTGRTFGAAGMFAGGTTVALVGGPVVPSAVRPHFPMHTLTVRGTDAAGRPDTGDDVFVYNVDDSVRFGANPNEALGVFDGGSTRYSVPAGHYSALALFADLDADRQVTSLRVVARPQFTVSADQTLAVAAKEATSEVTMVTPRPSLPVEGGFVVRRVAAAGPSFYLDAGVGAGVPVRVSPTAAVSIGALQSMPYRRLVSPPAPGTPYEYQLQYPVAGRIPAQRYRVRDADLATADSTYHSDTNTIGFQGKLGVEPFEYGEFVGRDMHTLTLPRHQTEYVTGDPSVAWLDLMYSADPPDGGQLGSSHSYRPGQRSSANWNSAPLHPTGETTSLPPGSDRGPVVPGVTRAGDLERIQLIPFGDGQTGHIGLGLSGGWQDTTGGSYRLSQDGTTVAGGAAPPTPALILQATVGAAASTMDLVLDASRTGPNHLTSTATHTEWTWHTAHESGTTLPAAFACARTRDGVDRHCAVEPLLTLGYTIGNLDPGNGTAAGSQAVDLAVGHAQQSAGSAVTGVAVQFSTDDGKTWQDATVAGTGAGTYRATFTAGPSGWGGAHVSLRTTATDAAGGRITETVARAWQVSGG